jgi:hypothetical protein
MGPGVTRRFSIGEFEFPIADLKKGGLFCFIASRPEAQGARRRIKGNLLGPIFRTYKYKSIVFKSTSILYQYIQFSVDKYRSKS